MSKEHAKKDKDETVGKEVKKDTDETAEKEGEIPKPQTTPLAKKNDPEKEAEKKTEEPDLKEIEKELDELRPPSPSPKSKRRMVAEEKKKDEEMKQGGNPKTSAMPVKVESDKHDDEGHHNDNELTPGQPDPTVNENTKIPVLNDHGDVELKPQLGSVFKKNHPSNTNEYTEGNKDNNNKNNDGNSNTTNQAAAEEKEKRKDWSQMCLFVLSSFLNKLVAVSWNSVHSIVLYLFSLKHKTC